MPNNNCFLVVATPVLLRKKAGTPFVGAPAGKWGFYSLDVLLIIC